MTRRNLIDDDEDQSSTEQQDVSLEMRHVLGGVTIGWLATVFRINNLTVKKRLANCPELKKGRGNSVVFDLAQAAAYLVKPKIDIKEFMKSVRPQDLPPYLQSEFWEAQVKRQKWEENAGELWRTEKVVELYAETFKLMKDTMNLWVDGLERENGLTNEQRDFLIQAVDGLQKELHQKLVGLQDRDEKTPNQLAEMKDIDSAPHYQEKPE